MRTLGVEGSINEPHPGIGRNHVSMIPWIIPCVRLKFKVFMKFHVTANRGIQQSDRTLGGYAKRTLLRQCESVRKL